MTPNGLNMLKHSLRGCLTLMVVVALLAIPAFAYEVVTEDQMITASDPEHYATYGYSVAIEGDVCFVGSERDDNENGEGAGSVYVLNYDSVSGTWSETQKIIAGDGGTYANFGSAVSIDADVALIGSTGSDSGSGAAYIYRYDTGTGQWNEEAKLMASDPSEYAYFGNDAILKGDLAIIGAYRARDDNDFQTGAVYVFRYDSGTFTWSEEAKLLASDRAEYDYFGVSVAMHDDRILTGAYEKNSTEFDGAGAAYLYTYDSGTGAWTEAYKFTASDAESWHFFGQGVDLYEDVAVIGAPGGQEDNGDWHWGAAYVYRYDSGSSTWIEEVKLKSPIGQESDYLGQTVVLLEDKLIVGTGTDSQPGHALYYVYDNGTWTLQNILCASNPYVYNQFGNALAFDGENAMIGAPFEEVNGDRCGTVYHFSLIVPYSVDIKANNQDAPLMISASKDLEITATIRAGSFEGLESEVWMLVFFSAPNLWGSYGGSPFPNWELGVSNFYHSGDLIDGDVTLWNKPMNVATGDLFFIIVLDDTANGRMSGSDILDYDLVHVVVVPG